MKRLAFTLLILSLSIGIQAQNYKRCPTCAGLGSIGGTECRGCGGKGLVPMSASDMAKRQKEIDDYADATAGMMDAFNLTPQEAIAYGDLIKEAMTQVPVYETCTTCGGTGKCNACGGYMNVSLDGPLCPICGGSGFCIACDGKRQFLRGYQENPNKDMYIQRAKEILEEGQRRAAQGLNANGVRNSAGTYVPSGGSGSAAAGGSVAATSESDNSSSSGKSSSGGSSSSSDDDSTKNIILGLMTIIAAFFAYRYYKKK